MSNEDYQPLVSVIMNCYNGQKYLDQAIKSVLSQTYSNWELIFWNDQSTDKSEIFFKNFNDKRLKYFISRKRTNLSEARILAIEKSKGDILTFLDVDDFWSDNFLENQVLLYKDDNVSFSCGNFYVITEGSKHKKLFRKKIPSGQVLNELFMDYSVGLLTLAVRRSNYFEVGGFSSDYHIIGDFDLVMRLANHGDMGSVQMPLAYCRKHDLNESNLKIDLHLKELEGWYKKNHNSFKTIKKESINYFYISILYKRCVDQINANSFSLALLRNAFMTQPLFNCIKLVLKLLFKKLYLQ
jgi:glycosyltransferase involved in cell wall biosynthesis